METEKTKQRLHVFVKHYAHGTTAIGQYFSLAKIHILAVDNIMFVF